MAFSLDIETPSGVNANYHRVTMSVIDFQNKNYIGVISSFYTKEARDANKNSLQSQEFNLANGKFELTDDECKDFADFVGLSPTQKLLRLQIAHAGAVSHCNIAVSFNLAGQTYQNEMQFQVASDAMPFDVLSKVYQVLAQSAPFDQATNC